MRACLLKVALPEAGRDGTGRLGVLVAGWTANAPTAASTADSDAPTGSDADAHAAACLLLPNAAAEAAVLRPDRPFFFHLVRNAAPHANAALHTLASPTRHHNRRTRKARTRKP